MQRLQISGDVVQQTFEELEKAYTHESRHYHNLEHIRSMLEGLEQWTESIKNREAIELSIWFHDVVYEALAKDNETKSAEWAKRFLQKTEQSEKLQDKVIYFIEKTANHFWVEEDEEDNLQLFLDLDLAILGQDKKAYSVYKDQVRQEYEMVPMSIYIPARQQVLQNFLKEPHIYRTAHFRDLYEAQARKNLAWEIDFLATSGL